MAKERVNNTRANDINSFKLNGSREEPRSLTVGLSLQMSHFECVIKKMVVNIQSGCVIIFKKCTFCNKNFGMQNGLIQFCI